jgi:hypothetical protein
MWPGADQSGLCPSGSIRRVLVGRFQKSPEEVDGYLI